MANVSLTTDEITREALRILHQKLNFCGNIVRDYDKSYAQTGAKIGNTLRVRLPYQYTSATGATMATGTGADSIGSNTTLTVSTQRHVPLRFTSAEKTMDIDNFGKLHLEPAMAQMAAMMEYDGLAATINAVNQQISAGTKVVFADVMNGRALIQNSLAPMDNRTALLDPQGMVDLVTDNKSLFNSQDEINKQYKEGSMGRFAGFDFYENTLLPTHTSGTEGGGSVYKVNGANQTKTLSTTDADPTTGSLIVDTGTKTIAAGDVFTIGDDVFAVHPETKVSTGVLKQFTVTTAATGAGTLTIAPAIISAGPHQNVSAVPDNDDLLTFVGAASTAYKQSLLFQKGFACMGTADLVLPPSEKASRMNYDGISIRVVEDFFDGVKDRLYTRLDILYGLQGSAAGSGGEGIAHLNGRRGLRPPFAYAKGFISIAEGVRWMHCMLWRSVDRPRAGY